MAMTLSGAVILDWDFSSNGFINIFGLTLQWGEATCNAGTVYFPIEFKSACFSLVGSYYNVTASSYYSLRFDSISTGSFTQGQYSTYNYKYKWFAVGV